MGAGPKLTIDAGDGRSMVRADIGGGTTMCFIGVRSNLAGNNKDISSTLVNIKYCNGTENTRQHVAATSCVTHQSDKSLCMHWRIFLQFLSLKQNVLAAKSCTNSI